MTVAGDDAPSLCRSRFWVLATQNPIELEGTYPLPEAQLDRFMMKVHIESPRPDVLAKILADTTSTETAAVPAVCTAADLSWLIDTTRTVPIARHLIAYAALLVSATHPGDSNAPAEVKRYVRAGASPRGGQAIILAAKARALLAGRPHVSAQDIEASALPALRHRLILGYEAAADRVTADDLVMRVITGTPEPRPNLRGTD